MFNTRYNCYTERLQDALVKLRAEASYDECTIKALRKDNKILSEQVENLQSKIKYLQHNFKIVNKTLRDLRDSNKKLYSEWDKTDDLRDALKEFLK